MTEAQGVAAVREGHPRLEGVPIRGRWRDNRDGMKRFIAATACWTAVVSGAAQPAGDPVEYPRGYEMFQRVRTTTVPRDPSHGTVFVNTVAASQPQLPYAYGSIIVMEWRRGGAHGEIVRLDVMRKERGFGEAYGGDRTGEWAYASYAADGRLLTGPAESLACAKCHAKAGAARDFVYGGPFLVGPLSGAVWLER